MNYAEMSDFEINGMIAESTQKFGDYTQARGLTFIHEYGEPVGEFGALCLGWKEFDPCKSWADAGPIIVSNLIALKPVPLFVSGHRWFATKGEGDFGIKAADNNPLRAAMIVFLMIQEQANA